MSRAIRNFQVTEFGRDFYDPLNNSSVHTDWTQEPGGTSTITEDGTDLTISDPGGSTLEWIDGGTPNAPNINCLLDPYNYTVKAYVSGVTSSGSNAGAIVQYRDGVKGDYHYIGLNNSGSGDDAYTHGKSLGTQYNSTGTSGACWLAMIRRGSRILALYSTAAVGSEPEIDDMTLVREYDTLFPYNDNRIALIGETKLAGNPAISIEFRNFRLTYP